MYIGVKEVKAMENHKLLITFENGEIKEFDMKPYLEKGLFKELKDEKLFNSVNVSFDSIEWANGLDLCPEVLYNEGINI